MRRVRPRAKGGRRASEWILVPTTKPARLSPDEGKPSNMRDCKMRGLVLALSIPLGWAVSPVGAQGVPLAVALTSEAFANAPINGEVVRFSANVEGGKPPYQFEWDLDGDGQTDRNSPAGMIEATYPRSGPFEVSVQVVDGNGQHAFDTESLLVRGPRLQVEPVGQFYGPANLNPGDASITQFVRATNVGDAPQPAGHVMFVSASAAPDARPAAVMLQALVPVPELAVGASADLMVVFNIDLAASCGQAVGVDYLGSLWAGGQSLDPQRVVEQRVAQTCAGPAPGPILIPPSPLEQIARRSALYFNPARPGNGMFNHFRRLPSPDPRAYNRREAYAGAWFTGLGDRTPVWYLLDGELAEGTGELVVRRFKNVAAPNAYAPASEVVGRAWTSRLDVSRVAFAWELDDGSSGIEWMETGPVHFSGPNHTQSWFDPNETGWGIAIETLYVGRPLEFVGAFVYDFNGEPRWLSGDIASFNGGEADLTANRPHCPACPWIVDWSIDGAPAGTLQLEYTAPNQAKLYTALRLEGPYRLVWQRDSSEIQPIAAP
jgi:hypothetical protein